MAAGKPTTGSDNSTDVTPEHAEAKDLNHGAPGRLSPVAIPDLYTPETNVTAHNPYIVHAVQPAETSVPASGDVTFRHVSARIALTERQHKMLQKKFKKWTEDYYKMELPDSTLEWEHKGQVYSARFQHRAPASSMEMDEVVVEIESEENGVSVSTEMRMRRLAFSNFAQFVDYWDPWVAVHDDVLEGRFHANSKINIAESWGIKPKFLGKVTTASYDVETSSNRPFFDDESVFLGGLETGVKEISLPRSFTPFYDDSTVALENIHRLRGEVAILFHADGSYTWKQLQDDNDLQGRYRLPQNEAYYIVGDKDEKLHLEGVVRGRVLVYSAGDIIIDDDLTYARHPEVSNVAHDYLGIVSEDDIEIAHPDVTGPGDLNIYASIFAKDRFVVRHLGGRGDDTLFIYGSLTAGTLSATEPRYATRIRFDKRLQTIRPPSFPMSNRYEVSEWDGAWKTKPSSERKQTRMKTHE